MKSRNLYVFMVSYVLAVIVLYLLADSSSVLQVGADILSLRASLCAGDSLVPTVDTFWRTLILAAAFGIFLTRLIDQLLTPRCHPSHISASASSCCIVAVAVFVIDIKLGWRLACKLGHAIDVQHFWVIQVANVVLIALIAIALGWLIGRIIAALYEERYNAERCHHCTPASTGNSNNDIPW